MTDAVLGSWKDSPVKQAIGDFVTSTTQEVRSGGGPDRDVLHPR
jgi:hypothetical protein